MDIEQIYQTYLNPEESGQGYQNDHDFMENLLQALDVILFVAVNQDKLAQQEQEELLGLVTEHIENRLEVTIFPAFLRLLQLRERESLSDLEVFCILIGAACSMQSKYEKAFALLQGNDKMQYASYGLACRLFEISQMAKEGAVLPLNVSEEFAAIYLSANGEVWDQVSLSRKPLITRRRVCSWLYGEDALPYELTTGCEFFEGRGQAVEFLQYKEQLAQLQRLLDMEDCPVIVLEGKSGSGRRQLVRKVMAERKESILFADYETMTQAQQSRERIEALFLESTLRDCAVCIYGCYDSEAMKDILRKGRHKPLLLTTDQTYGKQLSSKYRVFRLTMSQPAVQDKIAFWTHFLTVRGIEGIDPAELSNKYLLNAGEIDRILDYACTLAASFGREQVQEQDILMAIRKKNSTALGTFAELLQMKAGWDDLIVEAQVRTQLQYICNRIIYKNVVGSEWGFARKAAYGKGTCALFYGPPGTGKTMAAQVLANELGLDLYRIDISQMISKYIGETQKNISELFDRAKDSNALLFFDEADAFFAKRTEVSDSNDRNANAEVAHLLQRLEGYEGISILATNLNENIDNAFKRRINYMVHFQLPDKETRRIFWNRMIPAEAPMDAGLDLEYFADHFEISGSEIKECVFHAAYMAASEGLPIENRHIIEALKLCMGKYGKILTKDDFGYLI